METTILKIFYDEEKDNSICVEAMFPLDEPKFCLELLQQMDTVKRETIKRLADANEKNMQRNKSFLYKVKQKMGLEISDEEEKVIETQLKKIEEAQKTGQGIQSTLNNLTDVLNSATNEDKDRMIRDINAAIKNIVGGA